MLLSYAEPSRFSDCPGRPNKNYHDLTYCGPPHLELERVARGRGVGSVVFRAAGREIGGWSRAVSTTSSDGALDRDSRTGEVWWAEIEGGLGLVRGDSFQRVTFAHVLCT